jgi:hypothetical protein
MAACSSGIFDFFTGIAPWSRTTETRMYANVHILWY